MRLAISSQLGGVEFKPPGMPPSAILIVRRFADSLPGRLPIQRNSTLCCTEWERAVNDRLGEFYRSAVHPRQGVVAAHADAVVFADEAELIACILPDLVRRTIGRRWWWKYLSKRLSLSFDGSGAICRLLSDKVIYLPATLDHLTKWGAVESIIHTLSTEDTKNLLSVLTEVFSLGKIRAGLLSFGTPLSAPAVARMIPSRWQNAAALKSINGEANPPSEDQGSAPWCRWLGISIPSHNLNREQACLWGLGLILHRMPSVARGSEFQKSVVDWLWEGEPQSVGSETSPTAGSEALTVFKKIDGLIPDSRVKGRPKSLPSTLRQKDPQKEVQKNLPAADRAEANHEKAAGTQTEVWPDKEQLRPISEQKTGAIISPRSDDLGDVAPDSGSEDRLFQDTEFENPVITHLGGVLYLINLMIELDLPHCFEKDWRLASRLGAWGLLEVLGRSLLGEESSSFVEDPLWAALAGLDGRQKGESPGYHFAGSETFRIPVSWFQQIGNDHETFRWAAMRRRLRLWSSEGYVIAEVSRDASAPHRQADMELQGYMKGRQQKYQLARSPFSKAPIDCPVHIKTSGLNEALLRWLEFTLPYIRYRLQLSFAMDSGRFSAIAGQFLTCPGKLYVTSTHVDFVTDINNISIPVRKTGLDRDPGWNPDLGRVVQFHFE